MGHENKCGHLHGHNYVGYFTAEALDLDTCGRVIDFSVLKACIGKWIDETWDHGFVYSIDDRAVSAVVNTFVASNGEPQKTHAMPYNPTAENIAKYLLHTIFPTMFLGTGITITKVEIQETENCSAICEL